MKAQNRYYEDPDLAYGFNNISKAILGSAGGDAAYELAKKRRAEAAQEALLLEAIEGAKKDPALAKQMLGKMEYDVDSMSPEALANFAVRYVAGRDPSSFVGGASKAAKTPYEIETEKARAGLLDSQAGKESAHQGVYEQQAGEIQDRREVIRDTSNIPAMQRWVGNMFGIKPGAVRATPEGMEALDFHDASGPMGSGMPQDLAPLVAALLTGSGKGSGSLLGLKKTEDSMESQKRIDALKEEKQQTENEISRIKKAIAEQGLDSAKQDTLQSMLETQIKKSKLLEQELETEESLLGVELATERIGSFKKKNEVDLQIQELERQKKLVGKEIEDTKLLIQNSKLTEQQHKEGSAKLNELQQMYEMLTAEQGHLRSIANAEIAQSNLAVTEATEAGKIEEKKNDVKVSRIEVKDAENKSSFKSKEIENKENILKIKQKIAENQEKQSEHELSASQSKADTAFSVFMEQTEDRTTKQQIGEQKVSRATSEAEEADIKKDIAAIQKGYEEELKPLKLKYQEKKNQKVSEEITTEQTLRYFNANKVKASTKAILDKLAASLQISAQDLLKATSQAELAATKATSAKDLAPGLKKIQKSKIQQEQDKAKLFAQELQQALKMDPVKFQKLMEQVDLIREQITGQTIENRILENKEQLSTIMLPLKEQEQKLLIELREKESEGASLKNIDLHNKASLRTAPLIQKAASTKKPSWGSTQDQLATEIYDGALNATYRLDSEDPNMIWQNRVPEAVRIKLKQNAIMDASAQHGDPSSPFFNNIRGAMNDAVNVIAGGVIIAKNDSVEVGIPNRLFTGVRRMVMSGDNQSAKGSLMDMGYTGVQADAIIERAEKSTSSQ